MKPTKYNPILPILFVLTVGAFTLQTYAGETIHLNVAAQSGWRHPEVRGEVLTGDELLQTGAQPQDNACYCLVPWSDDAHRAGMLKIQVEGESYEEQLANCKSVEGSFFKVERGHRKYSAGKAYPLLSCGMVLQVAEEER